MESPRKSRVSIHLNQAPMMEGLKMFTIKNRYNAYVVPSNQNFVGEFEIRKVAIDRSSSTSIWPILSKQMLFDIFEKYDQAEHSLTISSFNTFSGKALTLTVQRKDSRYAFPVHLGLDIYPKAMITQESRVDLGVDYGTSVTIESNDLAAFQPVCVLTRLNFFLCSEDISTLLSTPSMMGRFQDVDDLTLLTSFSRAVPRRDSGLLGTSSLKVFRLSAINHRDVDFYFDTMIHTLERVSWPELGIFADHIYKKKYLGKKTDHAVDLNTRKSDFLFVVCTAEELLLGEESEAQWMGVM